MEEERDTKERCSKTDVYEAGLRGRITVYRSFPYVEFCRFGFNMKHEILNLGSSPADGCGS